MTCVQDRFIDGEWTPHCRYDLRPAADDDREAAYQRHHVAGLTWVTNSFTLVLFRDAGREVLSLRDGRVTSVDTLTEVETLDFGELGPLEAFVTSGGTSTAPHSLAGRVAVYENKTLRYPGHLDAFRAFKELGLFDETSLEVEGTTVTPRAVFHRLLAPRIGADVVEDVCVMRAIGRGTRDGRTLELTLNLVDRYDPATGFSAMERLTGWHAAIMAGFVADGTVPSGVHPVERAMAAARFMEEVRRRGFVLREEWTPAS